MTTHERAEPLQLTDAEDSPPKVSSEIETDDNSPETDENSPDSSEKSASIQKYEEEWAQLYRTNDPELGELRRRAVLGNLRASRFRSVCWRSLLGVFSPDPSLWLQELRQYRKHYRALVEDICIDPWHRNLPHDNPLCQGAESIWHQYFCDKELQAVIKQDVVRTFPGVDFFRKDMIQDAMVNILFCYARENPTMCYRQGMHEILAPLLFVLHCDHQALLHTKEQVPVSDVVFEVLDPACLKEDGYTLFSHIMRGIESCYRINDLTPTPTGYFPPNKCSPPGRDSSTVSENEVVAQLNWIRDCLLAPNDPPLYQHLQKLDIPLPLFGIRWLRLLFGREFPLQDLLVLWDAIFAEGQKFELVNYVVVAMLIAIRHQLLNGDYTTCLTYLMRYPGAVDITYIIENALYLKDPQKHCLPSMASFPNLPLVTVGGRTDLNRAVQLPEQGPGTLAVHQPGTKADSNLSGTLIRLKKLSTRPSRWVGNKHVPQSPGRGDKEAGIVEGFTLDDPAVLRSKLNHAYDVMSLCRLKLMQYHTVLQKSVHTPDIPEAQQALDGIHQLCSLLSSRHHLPPPEVEPAYEAGEVRVVEKPQRAAAPPSQLPLQQPLFVDAEKKPLKQPRSRDVPRSKGRLPSREMDVYTETKGLTGQKVVGAPVQNPLAPWEGSGDDSP